jgi:xylose isomerase
MSGGRFGYSQHKLTVMVEEIESIIQNNGVKDEWGYADNFSEETLQEFRNGIAALKRAYVYAQRIDWLVSGDDSEPYFHKRLQQELKELDRD